MLFKVILRLGDCESARLCNRLGRSIHAEYKKLEGSIQKTALVLTVNASEPAAAVDAEA